LLERSLDYLVNIINNLCLHFVLGRYIQALAWEREILTLWGIPLRHFMSLLNTHTHHTTCFGGHRGGIGYGRSWRAAARTLLFKLKLNTKSLMGDRVIKSHVISLARCDPAASNQYLVYSWGTGESDLLLHFCLFIKCLFIIGLAWGTMKTS
jgi:hypothetical protein